MKRILYGICGIGNGHTYRQLPTITYLAKSNKIMIFAYGDSLRFFRSHFKESKNVEIAEVAVPYYIGNATGIDFETSAKLAEKSGINVTAVNAKAMAKAKAFLGVADLAITDYEPIAALYAYAYNVPLITIDQQSKYLSGDFPERLNGYTYIDEVERLRMFFPRANARIACSFFDVPQLSGREKVHILPPVLRSELKEYTKRNASGQNEILVYLSAQQGLNQPHASIITALESQDEVIFHIFLPKGEDHQVNVSDNLTFYEHGDKAFNDVMQKCSGIITTAGHSLLSEAMYLGIPVLALPLPLYEQQMNAEIINNGGFGICADILTPDILMAFIHNLDAFAKTIQSDKKYLLRGDGQKKILNLLRSYL